MPDNICTRLVGEMASAMNTKDIASQVTIANNYALQAKCGDVIQLVEAAHIFNKQNQRNAHNAPRSI